LRRVVYTVLVGGFDSLLPPACREPEVDYIAFADVPQAVPVPWQARPLASLQRNPRMTARWHKVHPHRLLPDYDQSLYLDANILIKDRILPLFDEALREQPLALFRHPARDCAYEEAEAVKRMRYDDRAIVDAQMAFYRAHGVPPHAGLHFGGVQFRRHLDPKVADLLEDWWRQLKIFSHRDQLSLDFMLRRHGLAVADLPGQITCNPWFVVGPHRRSRVDLAASQPPVEADEIDWLRFSFVDAARESSRGWRALPGEAGRWLLRKARKPGALGRQIVRRLTWRRHLARHGVEPKVP
jgi:hypothetical protein